LNIAKKKPRTAKNAVRSETFENNKYRKVTNKKPITAYPTNSNARKGMALTEVAILLKIKYPGHSKY
jgi:hypothetical protein